MCTINLTPHTGGTRQTQGHLQARRVLREGVPREGAGGDPAEEGSTRIWRLLRPCRIQNLLCHPYPWYQRNRTKTPQDPSTTSSPPNQQRCIRQGDQGNATDAAAGRALHCLRVGFISMLSCHFVDANFSEPNLKSIRELIYKRGYGKVDKQRIPLSNNAIIEEKLGKYDILCIEDLVHEIATAGPNFKQVSTLTAVNDPFLSSFYNRHPTSFGLSSSRTPLVAGGHGNSSTSSRVVTLVIGSPTSTSLSGK